MKKKQYIIFSFLLFLILFCQVKVSVSAKVTSSAFTQVTNGKSGKLSLSWKKASGISGYEISRSTSKKGKYKVIKTITKASTTKYTDKKLKNGKTYYYKIRTYKKKGKKKTYSSWSKAKKKKVTKNLQETESFHEFSQACSSMVSQNMKLVKGKNVEKLNPYVTGRLIVKGKKSVSFTKYKPTQIIESTDSTYIVQFKNASDAKKAAKKLTSSSAVSYVEPDRLVEESWDAAASSGQTSSHSWGVSATGANAYAEYVKLVKPRSSITVAVIDSGVSSHTLLNGRLLSNGTDLIDNDSTPTDSNGHGTHVAGIIADSTPGLNVKILPIRVLNKNGIGTNVNIGNGIKYAVDHGAKVINISIAGIGYSKYLDTCINNALKKNVSVVIASGNDNMDTKYCSTSHVTNNAIVVSAVDSSKRRWGYSNYGASVDIAAPGVNISSCSNRGNGYTTQTGTSMAAPHISGIVAMYRMMYPSYNVKQMEQYLTSHTINLGAAGKDKYYGHGFPTLANQVKPTSISLNKKSLQLAIGDSITLTASIAPSSQAKSPVTWKSSNNAVATVKNGVVQIIGAGKATITATTSNGLSSACNITSLVYPTAVTVNKSALTLEKGSSTKLSAMLQPSNTTQTALTWNSSNAQIASVSTDGTVTAKAAGTATITVKTVNGHTASCQVIVEVSPAKISFTETTATMEVGKTKTLSPVIQPADCTKKALTWSSSNPTVATVDNNGTVRTLSSGKATITATTSNGLSATCNVTAIVYPTAVTVNRSALSLEKGSNTKLSAMLQPSNTTQTALTWNSSNAQIVSVSTDGTVTAKAAGTATITVKTVNGHTASCQVTVEVSPTNIYFTETAVTMNAGQTRVLSPVIEPSDCTKKALSWSSSDSSAITVDRNGTLNALDSSDGTTITVKTENGLTATCTVTARGMPTSIQAHLSEDDPDYNSEYSYTYFVRKGSTASFQYNCSSPYTNTYTGDISVKSADSSIAKVLSATRGITGSISIEGIDEGETAIRIDTGNDVYEDIKVEVYTLPYPLPSLTDGYVSYDYQPAYSSSDNIPRHIYTVSRSDSTVIYDCDWKIGEQQSPIINPNDPDDKGYTGSFVSEEKYVHRWYYITLNNSTNSGIKATFQHITVPPDGDYAYIRPVFYEYSYECKKTDGSIYLKPLTTFGEVGNPYFCIHVTPSS